MDKCLSSFESRCRNIQAFLNSFMNAHFWWLEIVGSMCMTVTLRNESCFWDRQYLVATDAFQYTATRKKNFWCGSLKPVGTCSGENVEVSLSSKPLQSQFVNLFIPNLPFSLLSLRFYCVLLFLETSYQRYYKNYKCLLFGILFCVLC